MPRRFSIGAVKASNPDIIYIACFPPDTVGIVKTINEMGYSPKLIGGNMVGPQYASIKTQLGPLLNRIVAFEEYVPEPTLKFPGIKELLAKYQAKAAAAGVDPLGFYLPPYVYAGLQMLGNAVEATKGVDHAAIADYLHKSMHKTIVGDIKYGPDGEWETERTLFVQYQGITGKDVEQFKQAGRQVLCSRPSTNRARCSTPIPGISEPRRVGPIPLAALQRTLNTRSVGWGVS